MMTDAKAESIASDFIETGYNATEALRRNGYKDSKYLHGNASNIIRNNTKVQQYIDQLYGKSENFFSNIESIANLSPEITTKDGSKADPVVLQANRDILDRLGHSAIKKSVSINTQVDNKQLQVNRDKIVELEAMLAEKEAKLK